ncbi:MAG: MipA/OmpV family protein [Rhodanobacter sp.]
MIRAPAHLRRGRPRRPLLSTALLLACVVSTQPCRADGDPTSLAIGAGIQRLPSWAGARNHRLERLPYLDVEWPDHVSLSTQDGLHVDLVGGSILHGGVYGDYQWGRDTDDLGELRHRINPLSPRLTLGGYLEWQLTRQIDMGTNLSHDINGAGSYLKLYGEWDLPAVGLLQHSLALSWQAMNGAAMNRFFGVNASQASALNVLPWQPGAGGQLASIEYDLFMPTSKHTGVAVALSYGRLLGAAASSPLVTHFGSATQFSESLAFVYHL